MRLAETLGYLLLKVACVMPCLYQTFQECLIGSLVCGIAFVHRPSFGDRSCIPQNRELDWGNRAAWLIEPEVQNRRGFYESLFAGIPGNGRQDY